MESLPGYDAWKTTEPDFSGPGCVECGQYEAELGSAYCADCRVERAEQDDLEDRALTQDARPSRPLTVTLDLATLPADITASIRTVLNAHGLVLVRASDTQHPHDRSEQVLVEMGRNVAGVIALAETEAQ